MASRAWSINVGGVDAVGSATITAPDLVTVAGHSLVAGDLVAVDTIVGGADGPLETGVTYYVRDVAGDTFKLSGSRGGNPILFASGGTAEVYSAVPSYSAEELRQIASHGMFHGAANRLGARQGVRPGAGAPVTVAGTQWTVQAHTGTVDPGVTSVQGPYDYVQLSLSDPLNPADGTNERIDALDLRVWDDDVDGFSFRRTEVVYVPGTPAGSPVADPVTVNSLRLATISVPATGNGDPVVLETAQWTVSSGGILPVRDESELPTVGTYGGMTAYQQDSGAVKVHDGSAWAVAASVKGFQLWQTIVYTSSTTFTEASFPGLRAVEVECWGGGGGGGGAVVTTATQASSGSGGAGGNWASRWVLVDSLLSSETVTVGAGGAPGSTGSGAPGGNTSFGAHCIGGGGAGGLAAGASVGEGGADAASTLGSVTGDEFDYGDSGEGSRQNGASDMAWSGAGGAAAHGGGGGRGRRSSTALDGTAGKSFGGGGGGAANGNSVGNASTGGAGAAGKVVVRLYV